MLWLCRNVFCSEKPKYVILAAALVGGINANIERAAEFIHINLAIQNNVISCAQKHHVEKLVFLEVHVCILEKH